MNEQPDWTAAPTWAQYWAADADGIAYWHERRPKPRDDAYWHSDRRKSPAGMVYLPTFAHWRWSLREREAKG